MARKKKLRRPMIRRAGKHGPKGPLLIGWKHAGSGKPPENPTVHPVAAQTFALARETAGEDPEERKKKLAIRRVAT